MDTAVSSPSSTASVPAALRWVADGHLLVYDFYASPEAYAELQHALAQDTACLTAAGLQNLSCATLATRALSAVELVGLVEDQAPDAPLPSALRAHARCLDALYETEPSALALVDFVWRDEAEDGAIFQRWMAIPCPPSAAIDGFFACLEQTLLDQAIAFSINWQTEPLQPMPVQTALEGALEDLASRAKDSNLIPACPSLSALAAKWALAATLSHSAPRSRRQSL